MDLVSIVVPVYNVEQYVEKCIQSLVEQTYSNIEIIVVNDGSTDSSGEICKRFVETDERIILINKENGGLSDARNAGIEVARGEYITFVDSDDWVSKYYVENLYLSIKQGDSDIAVSQHRATYNEKLAVIEEATEKSKNIRFLSRQQALTNALDGKLSPAATAKLYKTKVFSELRYPKGILYEDLAIIFFILLKVESIVVIDNADYYYLQRVNSIMRSDFSLKQIDSLSRIKKEFEYLLENCPDLHDKIIGRLLIEELYIYYRFRNSGMHKKCIEEYIRLRKCIRNNIKSIKKMSNIKKSYRIRVMSYCLGWPVFKNVISEIDCIIKKRIKRADKKNAHGKK